MTEGMGADRARFNADVLERALALGRRALVRIPEDEERNRRAQALELIEQYTALLREPPAASPFRPDRYAFKLVFPDGRWSIDEKQLSATPRTGDVVDFDGIGHWRVQRSEHVGVKPAGKPPRRFYVCAPAA
jgi:hypothetical protein